MADKGIRDFKMPDGTMIHGVELDFDVGKENWNEYLIKDDKVIRIKNTLIRAIWVYDDQDRPMYDDLGDPQIYVNTTVIALVKDKQA